MTKNKEADLSAPPKLRRSRNGCMECRRLHRRCDEEKPACVNCRTAGKVCVYRRTLSWGGRPFGKSTFRHALGSGVVEIPVADTGEGSPYRRSFIYGQPESSGSTSNVSRELRIETRSRSVPDLFTIVEGDDSSPNSATADPTVPPTWLPWLSRHHRMLFHHFIESTMNIFTSNSAAKQEIRSAIIPMAVDTNHGFSLLAAIVSLASTHQMNLGLHQDRAEIEYWRDMSVGHLRRPTVQEDESTENVFAGTALILAIRDVISSDGEKSSSWRVHLQGALTVLARVEHRPGPASPSTERLLRKIATSLQLRSPLPQSSLQPAVSEARVRREDREVEALGLPGPFAAVSQKIRALKLERNALFNIESNSGSANMQRLWNSLRGQCLELIVQLRPLSEGEASDANEDAEQNRLYSYVALLQVYSGVLDLRPDDSGLRSTLETAVRMLRSVHSEAGQHVDSDLIFAVFAIGCLVQSYEDREMVRLMLSGISNVHGKRNAAAALDLLEELWREADSRNSLVMQTDVDTLIAGKRWDLSLW